MAEIEIVYREGYCDYNYDIYCMECHTDHAEDVGCSMFDKRIHEEDFVPFGDCVYANFKYAYKGMSIKNYELKVDDDVNSPYFNCMMLKTRNGLYPCEQVVLNGKVIFGEDFCLLDE